MKKKKKNKVKCDVISCLYNDIEEGDCSLNKIKISQMHRGNTTDDTISSTVCQSFEKTSGNITDTEYEVSSELENDKK